MQEQAQEESKSGPQAGGAEAIVSGVMQGLMKLMDVFKQANLPPEDVKMLGDIITNYQALIESLSGAGEESAPSPQPMQGPMDAMAAKGSQPSNMG